MAAELGDLRRFENRRQLMAFLGLVPRERSTRDTVRRAGLTLTGDRHARRVLVEAARSYRYPARVSETLRGRLEGLPKPVRDIAWKAQIRLCARYRRLSAAARNCPWSSPPWPARWPPSRGQSPVRSRGPPDRLLPDPTEPGAVLAALKTKPPAAVARSSSGAVLTAAARGSARFPGRDGETVLRSNKETGSLRKRDRHDCQLGGGDAGTPYRRCPDELG
jgi:hypothetical protein